MVCGGFLNCDPPTGPKLANADITGYGVLVAFMMSAVMTVTAVIYSYLSDSMPEKYLSETDKAIIVDFQEVSTRLLKKQPFRFIGLCWLRILRLVCRRKAITSPRKLQRAQREAAITRFILTLSDQQLAVGIAILLAAISNQCSLSVSEFQIAYALAWFSTATHLATLDSLRQYFIQHPTIRNWRVFGMLLLMVLFLYCFVVTLFTNSARVKKIPVRCYLGGSVLARDPNYFYTSLYLVAWVVTFQVIIAGYKSRIFEAYGFNSSGLNGFGLLSVICKVTLYKRLGFLPTELNRVNIAEWKQVLDEAALEQWSEAHRTYLEDISRKGTTILQRKVLSFRLAGNMYRRSLLPVVPSLTFMLTYGFVQMVFYRWMQPELEVDTSMGFGQITPLFLLVLPVLAAAEIYYESMETLVSQEPIENNSDTASPAENSPCTSGVARSETLPVVSSDDLHNPNLMDLEENGRLYDSNITLVRKYFYRQSKEIDALRANAATEDDIGAVLRKKRNIWGATKVLDGLEEGLPLMYWVKCQMLLLSLYSAIPAVFMNIQNPHLSLAGALLLYLQFLASVAIWAITFIAENLGTYARLLSEARLKGSKQSKNRSRG